MIDQGLFNQLLAQKYAIQMQNANADTTRANAYGLQAGAAANMDNVKAGLLPKETEASIAEQNARTAGQLETNKFIGPTAMSDIALKRNQGLYYGANARYIGTEANTNDILNRQSPFEAHLARLQAASGLSGAGGL